MASIFIHVPNNLSYTDEVSGEFYAGGSFNKFDGDDADELAEANRFTASGAGFDVVAYISGLFEVAWSSITGKPSSFTPSAHVHAWADITTGKPTTLAGYGITDAMTSTAIASALASYALSADVYTKTAADALLDAKLSVSAYTAGDILSKLLTVDGGASGLDSQYLAGQSSSHYLDWGNATNTPDTLAGYGITDAMTAAAVASAISAALDTLLSGAPGALDTLNELAAAIGDDADFAGTITALIGTKLDSTAYTAADVLAKLLTVDGAGSLLDADKLDGLEGSYYLAFDNLTGLPTTLSGYGITDAYTKTEVNGFLGSKANSDDVYTKAATNTLLDAKANSADVYTKAATNTLLDAKADLDQLPYASIAQYTSTDTVTDLADAGGAIIQWDSAVRTDSGISVGGTNDTEITVAEDGVYRFKTTLAYEDTSTEGVDVNNSIGVFYKIGGVARDAQGTGSVVLNTAGANEGQVTHEDILVLTTGQIVTVCTQRLSGADTLTLRANQSALIVERVGGKSALLAAQVISDILGLQAALDDKLAAADVLDEDDLASDSATLPPSQQSVKAYVDAVDAAALGLGDVDNTADADKPVSTATQTALDGKADLVGGKVPTSQLPDSVLGTVSYQSTWNASTNTPTMDAAATGNKGHYFKVAVAGATDIDGITDWDVGDWIVSNGSVWEKIDNTEPNVSAILEAQVGIANGIAGLNADGLIPADSLAPGAGISRRQIFQMGGWA